MADVTYLGDPLFSKLPNGRPCSRIATIFPRYDTIVTIPTIHAWQIEAFVDQVRAQRTKDDLPPLSYEEEQEIRGDAVPAVIEGDFVQLRPMPEDMATAFRADKLLRQLGISKRRVKYLNVFNQLVREALRARGELWRIARLPTQLDEMKQRITEAKCGIQGRAIYYHNATTGTRWSTFHEFSQLAELDDAALRQHLAEIQKLSVAQNASGNPEIAFFQADPTFTGKSLAEYDFAALTDSAHLREVFGRLCQAFGAAVPSEFQADDLEDAEWRRRMFSVLVAETDDTVPDEMLLALSPEFYMQIRWLPGGRMKNGRLVFDEVFEEEGPQCPFAENARQFLFNLVREHGDLEYVNIGLVVNSLSRRPLCAGRREVYLVAMKRHGQPAETVSVIRMQKWGVAEHLKERRGRVEAMFRSDEYTEYVLDRRFACNALGMNIPTQFTDHKICEQYRSSVPGTADCMIWSPYFQRPYVRGIATDKLPRSRFQQHDFALAFARLLGGAAAANIIVGRCDERDQSMFDDGDEIVVTDDTGWPLEIVVADQTGTFRDYCTPLRKLAPAYAEPINRRLADVADPAEFARVYIAAFVEQFTRIQTMYRLRRKAFESLFRVRPYDGEGCFKDRWNHVLARLEQSDPQELGAILQAHLKLPAPHPAAAHQDASAAG